MLKTQNDELHEKNKCLKLSLEKANKEKEELKNALEIQRKDFHKRRKGQGGFVKRKQNFASHSKITCHYCGQCGHSINKCFIRNHPTRYKQIWIPKGNFNANYGDPKEGWAPKFCG